MLFNDFLTPGALVTLRTHQVTGKAPVHCHHCFLIGGNDLVAAFLTLICPHADFKLDRIEAGNEKHISFKQKMSLQGGEYLLSLGVTGYEKEKFEVYHRLYDVINVTVVSDKNTVGYYDMNSKVIVK